MLKVNNKNTRAMSVTLWRCSCVFNVNFEQISNLVLVFLFLSRKIPTVVSLASHLLQKNVHQAFANCMHGYNCARNMHLNSVTRAQKFCTVLIEDTIENYLFPNPHRPLCFKKIITTTTTAFLISNTAILNP